MMEEMGDKLDQHLLHAFRPVAFGIIDLSSVDGQSQRVARMRAR